MNLKNRRGATLVEVMIVGAIVAILVVTVICVVTIAIGVQRSLPWLDSQSVTDIKALEAVESMDFRDVVLVDSFRVNPQGDLGCATADNAGFTMTAVNLHGRDVTIDVCCLGSPGSTPRCKIVNSY